jgi:hypothetical protein
MKKREIHFSSPGNHLSAGVGSRDDNELCDRKVFRDMACCHAAEDSQANGSGEAGASPLVRVEIDATTLLQLLKGRRLCAADMRCLDCESKRCLLRLLLRACAQDLSKADSMNHYLMTS